MESRYVLSGGRVRIRVGDHDHDRRLVIDPEVDYSTYLPGGSGGDRGLAIAVDAEGAAYVTGITLDSEIPTKNAAQPNPGGDGDALVVKLKGAGAPIAPASFCHGRTATIVGTPGDDPRLMGTHATVTG